MEEKKKRHIAILGSTGSIGTQALDIIRQANKSGTKFELVALSAGSNLELLVDQIKEFSPKYACIESVGHKKELAKLFPKLEILEKIFVFNHCVRN